MKLDNEVFPNLCCV